MSISHESLIVEPLAVVVAAFHLWEVVGVVLPGEEPWRASFLGSWEVEASRHFGCGRASFGTTLNPHQLSLAQPSASEGDQFLCAMPVSN